MTITAAEKSLYPAREFVPRKLELPERLLDAPTAWNGCESILADIVERFCSRRKLCLEFGVQHAYSTVALSNYFEQVVGVDTFLGDPYAGEHPDNYLQTVESVKDFNNIVLVQSSWQEMTKLETVMGGWDLIHVDIIHTYEETFGCGLWAVRHAPVVLFHDTDEFTEVRHAVSDLAIQEGLQWWNWPYSHGLGILTRDGSR